MQGFVDRLDHGQLARTADGWFRDGRVWCADGGGEILEARFSACLRKLDGVFDLAIRGLSHCGEFFGRAAMVRHEQRLEPADRVVVQYGGSVKADNAEQLLACPDIDGALVGGASLKASDFLAIIKAGQEVTVRGKS